VPTGLSQFPIKTKLSFLKASRLRFRRVGGKPKSDKKYQEIRYISRALMGGWVSFLNPDSPDDNIYTKLTIRVSVQNFPNSSFQEATLSVTTTGVASVTVSDPYPNDTTHLANIAAVAGTDYVLAKTANYMTQTSSHGPLGPPAPYSWKQEWRLSDPITVREKQKQMVDNLVFLKTKVLADQAVAIAAGTITFEDTWDNVWLIDADQSIQGFPDADVKSYSGGLVSANPPTGLLPPIAGRILQIERGIDAISLQDSFIDLVGVQGGNYYPGSKLANRLSLIFPPLALIVFNDPVYNTNETIFCSQVSHRIQVPICKALLNGKLGDNERLTFLYDLGFPISTDAGLPALTSYGTTVGFGQSPNAPGEVAVDTPCPALGIPDFWNAGSPAGTAPDDYWEYQLSTNDPATCINGYVIPDKCGSPPDGDGGGPLA
jgi:hypothetical protein